VLLDLIHILNIIDAAMLHRCSLMAVEMAFGSVLGLASKYFQTFPSAVAGKHCGNSLLWTLARPGNLVLAPSPREFHAQCCSPCHEQQRRAPRFRVICGLALYPG